MKINVRVIPKASKDCVTYLEDKRLLKVWTTAAPANGEANKKVITLISEYLSVNKKFIQISTGLSSKNKIIEINADISEADLIKSPRLL